MCYEKKRFEFEKNRDFKMASWEWILGIFGILLLLGVLAGLGYLIYYESKKHSGHNTVICANNPVTPPGECERDYI